MNDPEWNNRRSWGRFFLRLGWVGCCVLLLTTITFLGSRYLSNRRLMLLAKPANPASVDPVLGWKRSIPLSLERLIGVDNDIALLFRPNYLLVQGQDVTDARIVEILEASAGITSLYIHNRDLPEGSMAVIAARHSPETFQFRLPMVDSKQALLLSQMKNLQHVNIGQFERQPRQNDWSWLQQLPALKKLEITLWATSEADVLALAQSPALENASFSGEDLTDRVLDRLCDAPSLHWLDLEGSQFQLHFSDGRKLPAVLESLDLRCPLIDDQSLAAIVGLPQLSRVSIYRGQVTATGLKTLAKLPALRQLWLSDLSQLTDEGLKELAQSRSLQEVLVANCSTTPAALIQLNDIPNWTEIHFDQVTFRRQPGAAKLMLTPENVGEVLEQQRESERLRNEVVNGPSRIPAYR